MKRLNKIILITGILLSTSLWADMDRVCEVYLEVDTGYMMPKDSKFIIDKCERNNVLKVRNIREFFLTGEVAKWCRYDRNVVTQSRVQTIGQDKGEMLIDLTCILYDRFPRRKIK
jgi:hypothetical protein